MTALIAYAVYNLQLGGQIQAYITLSMAIIYQFLPIQILGKEINIIPIFVFALSFIYFFRVFVTTEQEDELERKTRYEIIARWLGIVLIIAFILGPVEQNLFKNPMLFTLSNLAYGALVKAPALLLMFIDMNLKKKIENYDYSREK